MTARKSTKLTIHEDGPTGIASSVYRSNIDAMGFNIVFIAKRNPKLAIEIMKLYDEARQIREDDPMAPDEDFDLFSQTITELFNNKQKE